MMCDPQDLDTLIKCKDSLEVKKYLKLLISYNKLDYLVESEFNIIKNDDDLFEDYLIIKMLYDNITREEILIFKKKFLKTYKRVLTYKNKNEINFK